jgi:hypothetical protein
MTEPWQIHVCPVHGPRTPTMLGDCPVGCCAEVMEVVRVVRDTRGDGVGVIAREWTCGRVFTQGNGNVCHAPVTRSTITSPHGGVEVEYVRSDERSGGRRGLSEAAARLLTVIRDALGPHDPIFAIAAGALAFTTDRGQSTAEEAFEQSSGGETLEEAQARQLRGEHAFSPQPESPLGTDEEGRSDV